MSVQLVIAEKPSVARSIAAVIGAAEKQTGYWQGGGYLVSWCIGHLVSFAEAGQYDEKYCKWKYEDLPILPQPWQFIVPDEKKQQFEIVRSLLNRPDVDSVTAATDGLIKIFRNWYSNDAIQGSKSQPVDWNKETTEQHSPVSALLERERTRYFSLPVYLTNTACGLLFAAVFVLLVVLMSDKITPYIYQLAEYFQVPFADYDVLFIYAFSILTTISCTTYVSISIEGKQIEILKSLPIAAKSLFRVKLLHHLSMSVPTIFVLNTIMALYLQWSFPKAMLGYAFPLLCSVLIGMIGYILNLIFPNFEWENVTHIIKQSLPAILTALIGVVVTCGTAYLLLRFFPSSLFIGSWIACAIILLLFLAMVTWVDKKGQYLYYKV